MNAKLIAAFHQYNSFGDIIDNSDVSSKGFEKLIIETIRAQYANPKVEIVEPDAEEEKAPVVQKSTEIELSDEQINFIHRALNGENLFLTAAAGYGKSEVIAETVRQLRAKYDPPNADYSKVMVCASTGRAASLISGKTVHSALGIGLAKQSATELYEKLITVRRMRPKYFELKNLKVLIIDEISMINAELFDKISIYLELIKDSTDPFGATQVICVGDLHQLPPVVGKYYFESATYRDSHFGIVPLTKCFRQTDPVFQNILNEARIGKLSDESYKILLTQNSIDAEKFKGIKPMLLRPTNREVDAINERELNNLVKQTGNQIQTYKITPISVNAKKIETVAKMEAIPLEVDMVVGAQIIITTNISLGNDQYISNGSMGLVLEMYTNHIMIELVGGAIIKLEYQKVLDPDCNEDVKPVYLFEYLPIRLGFSISIHRAQGCSVDCMEVDLSRVFGSSMGYVAISRVRTLAGLQITGMKRNSFKADPKVIEFYARHT